MAVLKYYNTATSAWEYIAASTTANFTTWKKTMSGGETSVSGTDDNGVTLSYTVGLEQVFINGALQARGSDYTATTGTTVTGLSALGANDIVSVVCYAPFNVTNTYTKSETDGVAAAAAGMRLIVPTSVAVGSGSGSANAAGFVTFSGVSSVSLNGIFSSTYDNYKIVLSLSAMSAQARVLARLRASGTDTSGTDYHTYGIGIDNSMTTKTTNLNSTTSWGFAEGNASDGNVVISSIDLANPFIAAKTKGVEQYAGITSSGSAFAISMNCQLFHQLATSYDGLTIFPGSGTMSGTIGVYGYKD